MFDPKKCDHVSMTEAQEREKQNPATLAARAASIAFVIMAEAGQIDDVTAAENPGQFSPWAYPVKYSAGNIRRHGEALFRCVQDHTSEATWAPPDAPSLWTQIGDPTEEWPAWSQPIGAHDAYSAGDKVSHGGKHWISDSDGNVWEPGVFGWTEVVAEQ